MEISIKHVGKRIVTLQIQTQSVVIEEDIADLNGKVDEQFIQDLENVTNELKEHNKELK